MKRWHYILITLALVAMAFSLGHSIQPKAFVPYDFVPDCKAAPAQNYYAPSED